MTSRLMLVGLVIAPVLCIAAVVWGDAWWATPQAAVGLWLSFTVFVTLIVWWGLWMTGRALVHLVQLEVFGRGLAPRLVALLVVVLMSPGLLRTAIPALFWAVTRLGLVLPMATASAAEDLSKVMQSTQSAKLPSVMGLIGHFLQFAGQQLETLAPELVERLPLSDLSVAVTVWALVAIGIRSAQAAGWPQRSWRFVQSRPSVNPSNVGFVLLLAISAFLSIAAVMSLPRLREGTKTNAEVEPSVLDDVLRGQMLTQEQVTRYLPKDLQRNPLVVPGTAGARPPDHSEIGASNTPTGAAAAPSVAIVPTATAVASVLPPVPAAPPEPAPSEPAPSVVLSGTQTNAPHGDDAAAKEHRDFILVLAKRERESLASRYAELVENGESLGAAMLSNQDKAARSTAKEYQLENLERLGSREEIQHFLLIQSWFAARVAEDEGALLFCAKLIRQSQQTLDRMASELGVLEGSRLQADVSASWNEFSSLVIDARNAVFDATRVCVARDFGPAPEPPPLGASLGPLQFVAGWLLDAASLPLALIVGMMGFGLLGAVISTFVRERRGKGRHEVNPHVIVFDLAGVVLRGLSAAVVVFLAVQGGLAVLSGAGSDPNPYVLLLACFVAAVFSERVWGSALKYLSDRLPGEGADANGGTKVDENIDGGPGRGDSPTADAASEGSASQSGESSEADLHGDDAVTEAARRSPPSDAGKDQG